jgi:hypothetical protein
LPSDRQKVLAFRLEQALRCPQCGTRREEWVDDKHAYVADVWRCIGCETVEYERKAWYEDDSASAAGLKFDLIRHDRMVEREAEKQLGPNLHH